VSFDAKGVEGVGNNGEGISPSPADYKVCRECCKLSQQDLGRALAEIES